MLWQAFKDQMGNTVELANPPQRIISLVPSQTELLHDLGLGEKIVGITKFCVHPPHWLKSKAIVGGTKNFQFDVIERLKPDLIIGNKEENYQEGILKLQDQFPVWVSDISTLENALSMIASISALTDCEMKGAAIRTKIQQAFSEMKPLPPTRVLYMMWRNPWMGAAAGTFIHAMIEKTGLKNVLGDQERYPELSEDAIKNLNPELIFLSSEPYPFSEKHFSEIRDLLPHTRIKIIDGEMFSWYGSRLALAPDYFSSLSRLS